MRRVAYVCPETHGTLHRTEIGYARDDGEIYPFVVDALGHTIEAPNFLDRARRGEGQRRSLEMYDTRLATEIYRNFLDWLFATFEENEAQFRANLVARLHLKSGQSVLITGCGLGDDIGPILDAVGPTGTVYAQDLSPAMISAAAAKWSGTLSGGLGQIEFSAGNALQLPFADSSFDAAFHFGGINLFDDRSRGIAEMARVVRPDGRVVVSDEGIAPWLRDTDFARMAIVNNHLWAYQAPIDALPPNVADAVLTWVLGNCFWVIEFTPTRTMPYINPHVMHKGRRGGSMWTRYKGQLEAVTPETKARVEAVAAAEGVSVHGWIERALVNVLEASD